MSYIVPKLAGRYNVACTDIITKVGRDRVFFRLYYPTQNAPDPQTVPRWLGDDAWNYAHGYADYLGLPYLGWLFRYLLYGAQLPCTWNGNFVLPEGRDKLPVVVFSHGLGGTRFIYSAMCLNLASHGCIVAAIEHADGTAATTFYYEQNENGERIKKWTEYKKDVGNLPNEFEIRNEQVHFRADDCIKLRNHLEEINNGNFESVDPAIDLSVFQGAFDFEKCVMMGHSFGAGTTVAVLSKDQRFKAAVCLDPWLYPLDKEVYKNVSAIPILFVNTEMYQSEAMLANIRKLDSDMFNVDVERLTFTVMGAVHQTHSDFPLVVPFNFLAKYFGLVGTIDPLLGVEIIVSLFSSFLGKHLNEDFGSPIEEVIKTYKDLVHVGPTLKLDEDKVEKSKNTLRSSL